MSTQIEELLRDGVDRLTADARAPAGLASRVRQRHGRRRMAIRAAAATGTAAMSAAVLVAAAGSGGVPRQHHAASGTYRSAGARAQTVADVIRHAERAISGRGLIMETTSFPGRVWVVRGTGRQRTFTPMHMVGWSYRDLSRGELSTPPRGGHGPGAIGMEIGFRIGPQRRGGISQATVTTVDYGNRTWSRGQELLPAGPAPVKMRCDLRHYLSRPLAPYQTNLAASPSSIRAALACGGLKIIGPGRADGVAVIKMTGTARLTMYPLAVDVSPATYLPVRLTFGRLRWDYRWLAPTAANLAALTVRPPAAFRRVASPAG